MALYVKADLHLKLQLVRLEVLVVAEVRALHRVDELLLVPYSAASNSDFPTILEFPGARDGPRDSRRRRDSRSSLAKHATRELARKNALKLLRCCHLQS